MRSVWNAIKYTALGIAFNVSGTMLYGYLLSRKDYVFKKFYSVFTLIPMLFGGGLIPSFLIIRDLGMYNTIWALVIPGGVSIWNALITKTFLRSNISDELTDAARIDGCGHFKIFFKPFIEL